VTRQRLHRGSRAPLLLAGLLACGLAGCLVGPDYEPPEAPMPDAWHQDAVDGLREGEANLHTWWTSLGDPELEELIGRAEASNRNLAQAVSRIREARLLRAIAAGEMIPAAGLEAEAARGEPPGSEGADNVFAIGIGASWEIDVFGRIRRQVESATATYEASIEDYRDILVTLFAEVGLAYVEVRALQERIAFAKANVEAQTDSLRLTRDRFAAGLTSALDVAQAESNLAQTAAKIPQLRNGLANALNRIAVLLGVEPGELHEDLREQKPIPQPTEEIAVGIPADLMRQRPDIRAAERRLAAQTAQIGVATAELYPQFKLGGLIGVKSITFSDLLDDSGFTWGIALPIRWNLFAGGRIRNNIRVQEERTQQALLGYEQAVLLALEDVENSLVGYVQEKVRRERLEAAVDATQRSVALVTTQYTAGLTDFQNVLDSQRTLFNQEDALAESDGRVVQNLIAIYKSLGGGWRVDDAVPDTFTVGAVDR